MRCLCPEKQPPLLAYLCGSQALIAHPLPACAFACRSITLACLLKPWYALLVMEVIGIDNHPNNNMLLCNVFLCSFACSTPAVPAPPLPQISL
jgi:hypothetical protein